MTSRLHQLFNTAKSHDASDIHLTVGEPPYFRIGGKIVCSRDEALTPASLSEIVDVTLNDKRLSQYEQEGYVDYAYETVVRHHDGDYPVRYRMHVYKSRGAMTAAMRRIAMEIPNFNELSLPPVYAKAVSLRPKGIIIIGGETGSGKSSTLAAMVNHINERQEKHIITIEDPIEFVVPNQKAKINQREARQDFESFPDALRAVVREDPDVIMIGELRDSETVRAAIAAAETGHLVFTSLHTATAPEAINRILYFFPPHEAGSVRQNLSATLIAIMNQMLLPTTAAAIEKTGLRRVPATEVLINTSVVRDYLLDPAHDHDLADLISGDSVSSLDASHDFNFSLKHLYQKDLIEAVVAMHASMRPEYLEMSLRGISVST